MRCRERHHNSHQQPLLELASLYSFTCTSSDDWYDTSPGVASTMVDVCFCCFVYALCSAGVARRKPRRHNCSTSLLTTADVPSTARYLPSCRYLRDGVYSPATLPSEIAVELSVVVSCMSKTMLGTPYTAKLGRERGRTKSQRLICGDRKLSGTGIDRSQHLCLEIVDHRDDQKFRITRYEVDVLYVLRARLYTWEGHAITDRVAA